MLRSLSPGWQDRPTTMNDDGATFSPVDVLTACLDHRKDERVDATTEAELLVMASCVVLSWYASIHQSPENAPKALVSAVAIGMTPVQSLTRVVQVNYSLQETEPLAQDIHETPKWWM